jgi:ADP-ribose pyrophosphatase
MERKNGSWTIKNSKDIFENEFFKVVEDEVVRPDGKDSQYATIDVKPGVAVLPIDEDGNVHLTSQFRYALERSNVECVAGNVEDEDILDGAKREAKEELGIEAEEWTAVGRIEVLTSITTSHTDLFIARGLKFGEPETEGTEELEPLKMSLEDAFEKVISGEITHAESCVLILKAHAQMKKQAANPNIRCL